jgi:hypothetical protein
LAVVAFDRATGAQAARYDTKGENLLAQGPARQSRRHAHVRDGQPRHARPRVGLLAADRTGQPAASQLKLEHRFAAGEPPDGIALGESKTCTSRWPHRPLRASPSCAPTAPQGEDHEPRAEPDGAVRWARELAFDGAGRILISNHAPVTGLATKKFSIVTSRSATTAGR